jgi:hypothetical protein
LAALAAFLERRATSLAFLGGVEPVRLARAIEPPWLGRMSGLDLVAAWVTRDRLHLVQLRRRSRERAPPGRRRCARSTRGRFPYPPG